MNTVAWQRIEGAALAIAALALAGAVSPGWPLWLWPVLLLAPDLAMLGYVAGPRIGAALYNLTHLYAWGLFLALIGLLAGTPALIAAGAVWIAHIGADRALGYGLKETSSFHDTHLGRIGRPPRTP